MAISNWLSNNWIEVFGAVTGIIYVFLEIRQNIWLWPVGIITSAVYIIVFFTSKFYADMSLQVYYLAISCAGWYWWMKGAGRRAQGKGQEGEKTRREEGEKEEVRLKVEMVEPRLPSLESLPRAKRGGLGVGLKETQRLNVTRLNWKTGSILTIIFVVLYFLMWFVLSRLTDSPVPEWDSFITSLSIVATWMLARKIYEHWFLWIIVNSASSVIFLARGLYPTVILYMVYLIMSFVGLKVWKRSL